MQYTVIIRDTTKYKSGVEWRVLVEDDDLAQVYGLAQVQVAGDIFYERHGPDVDPTDGNHDDEWMRIYDHIPVICIIEGRPKVWINDCCAEPDADNYEHDN